MTLVSDAIAIARCGIRAAHPGPGVRQALAVRRGRVLVGGEDWCEARRGWVQLVGLGKAAGPMVDAARTRLGKVAGKGIVAVPRGYPAAESPTRTFRGEHPVPGAASERAGRALVQFLATLPPSAPVLFLVSGGGSSCAEIAPPPLTVPDVAAVTQLLLDRGAPIGAVNVVRRHLSSLKGGGLARAASSRPCRTLALSDVAGDAPWDIASGPTILDPTTFRDALAVVRRYRLGPVMPKRALRYLQEGQAGRRPESVKPDPSGRPASGFHLVGSNSMAREAAAREAARRGYPATVLEAWTAGESSKAGLRLARKLVNRARRSTGPSALISGGETTVALGRHHGSGGRSQELAAAATPLLAGIPGVVLLAVATDGADGDARVAGAWVDGGTAQRARRRHVDLGRALRDHETRDALRRVGGLVATGPTGTNVADLQIGLVAPRSARLERRTSRRSPPTLPLLPR